MSGETITERNTKMYPTNEVSLCNFFASLGFKARKHYQEQYLKCGSSKIGKYDSNAKELIRFFNLPVETCFDYYTCTNTDITYDIKQYFKLINTDKISISLDIDYGRISLTSYGTTKQQHRAIVRRIYCPLKKFDPKTEYNCHSEKSSSECLR
jgi:hypothetical protein